MLIKFFSNFISRYNFHIKFILDDLIDSEISTFTYAHGIPTKILIVFSSNSFYL